MTRFITVGAAQMGPVGRDESRAAVVVRLLEMMREAKSRGCDLVVFTECALTPYFPRWWEDDLNACDQWFEREMPGPDTQMLFIEAKKLGIGFHLGYAELAERGGRFFHYNTSILVGPDGQILGKHRKIHLPGQATKDRDDPYRSYEKRYFDVGNLGFRAWRCFGTTIGMCLGNDRRWSETYRVLGLQGAELILLGYNSVADHPNHPELDHLTNFHSMLSMQAGAYQNGCYVVGVAKAGNQDGVNQIGRSAIIAPSGEVVTQCTTLADELVVHRCNLDQTKLYKERIFHFAATRQIEAYSLITHTRGAVPPQEPLGWEKDQDSAAPAGQTRSIQKLFTKDYGYSAEQAEDLAARARLAEGRAEAAEAEEPAPTADIPIAELETAEELPAVVHRCEIPPDPLEAVRTVLQRDYNYPESKIEPLIEKASRALELVGTQESDTKTSATKAPEPDGKPRPIVSEIVAQSGSPPADVESKIEEALPSALPVAEDIGWLPGRFPKKSEQSPDRVAVVVERLMQDYRYPEEVATRIAEFAETAWKRLHEPDEPTEDEPTKDEATPPEPAPTAVYVPEEHPELSETLEGKPLTSDFAESPTDTSPALSGEEAFHVYSVFTEKYGYNSKAARGIAERASSAWARWKNASAAAQEPQPSSPAPTVVPMPQPASPPSESPKIEVPETEREPVQTVPEVAEPEPVEASFVIVPCPECEFELKIQKEYLSLLGRKARCPKCQTKFRLPESV